VRRLHATSAEASLALDQRLVREAGAGNEDAFGALFDTHRRSVYRIARAVTGDHETSLDVVQDTFVKVYRGLNGWKGRSSLRTWIARIAIRAAIDQRRRAPPRGAPLDGQREPSHDPRGRLEDEIALQRLHELAERLDGQQGLILRLRLLGQLSNAEVAQALGLRESNVRMQLSKAVRRLREML